MMNMNAAKLLILPAALALTFAACSRTDEPGNGNPDGHIRIVTDITRVEKDAPAGMEKAHATRSPQLSPDGSGTFADGDTYTLVASGEEMKAYALDYVVGSTSLLWSDLPTEAGTRHVTFAAYYPKQHDEAGTFAFNAAKADDSDLLVAPAVTVDKNSDSPVRLAFRHAMHKLTVNYTSEDGSLSDGELKTVSTRCQALTTCQIDPVQGKVAESSATVQGEYAPKTGQKVSVLIVPQGAEHVSLQISYGKDKTRTVSLRQDCQYDKALESGKELTVNLDFTAGGIRFTGYEIEGWGTQGSASGEITQE